MHCTFIPNKTRKAGSSFIVHRMSTSTKRDRKKELPIYDPEGVDPEGEVSYEEVHVPLQEHVTTTRRAVQHTWSSVQNGWVRATEDTRSSITRVVRKTRKHTNDMLSSLGVQDSTQLVRGTVYAGAALTGLYLARRRSLFLKVLYPMLGAGLVGGAFHRHALYSRYQSAFGGSGYRGNWLSWQQGKSHGGSVSSSRWQGWLKKGDGKKTD